MNTHHLPVAPRKRSCETCGALICSCEPEIKNSLKPKKEKHPFELMIEEIQSVINRYSMGKMASHEAEENYFKLRVMSNKIAGTIDALEDDLRKRGKIF